MTGSPTLVARVTKRIQVTKSGCWEWTGSRHRRGYGRVRTGGRDTQVENTHRVVWELVVGPIPDGMHLDHLCKNPPCCNPAHLEVVTPRENAMRSDAPTILIHLSGRCSRGHERTPENTYRRKDRPGHTECLACRRGRSAA